MKFLLILADLTDTHNVSPTFLWSSGQDHELVVGTHFVKISWISRSITHVHSALWYTHSAINTSELEISWRSLVTKGNKRYTFIFSKDVNVTIKRCCRTFICLPLTYMEGIVLICNMDLYCVIEIFNSHR